MWWRELNQIVLAPTVILTGDRWYDFLFTVDSRCRVLSKWWPCIMQWLEFCALTCWYKGYFSIVFNSRFSVTCITQWVLLEEETARNGCACMENRVYVYWYRLLYNSQCDGSIYVVQYSSRCKAVSHRRPMKHKNMCGCRLLSEMIFRPLFSVLNFWLWTKASSGFSVLRGLPFIAHSVCLP